MGVGTGVGGGVGLELGQNLVLLSCYVLVSNDVMIR